VPQNQFFVQKIHFFVQKKHFLGREIHFFVEKGSAPDDRLALFICLAFVMFHG
jgi:hypothetical protein